MKCPIDASDAATLVQADWHEEYGDIAVAQYLRSTVDEIVFHWVYERLVMESRTDMVGSGAFWYYLPGDHLHTTAGAGRRPRQPFNAVGGMHPRHGHVGTEASSIPGGGI